MASLDSLPADQKAVLSLVLQRGRSFDEIAALLSIDRAAVRQRALEGFDALGPSTTLDPLKRSLITDYLLGQLPAPVADNVRASIGANPAERAWARVIAAEIGPLAVNGLPEIPAAAPRAPEPEPEDDDAQPFEPEPTPVASPKPAQRSGVSSADASPGGIAAGTLPRGEARAGAPRRNERRTSRRGGAILLGLLALVIAAVVVVLVLTGGSSNNNAADTSAQNAQTDTAATQTGTGTGTGTAAVPLHQINLTSPTGAKGREGAADVVRENGTLGVVLVATGLEPNEKNAYAVWLFNSNTGASHRLGFYTQTNSQGQQVGVTSNGKMTTAAKLPANAKSYNELLVTLETSENPPKPGTVVLQGTFAE